MKQQSFNATFLLNNAIIYECHTAHDIEKETYHSCRKKDIWSHITELQAEEYEV